MPKTQYDGNSGISNRRSSSRRTVGNGIVPVTATLGVSCRFYRYPSLGGQVRISIVGVVKIEGRADLVGIDVIDDVDGQLSQPATRSQISRQRIRYIRGQWCHAGDREEADIKIKSQLLPCLCGRQGLVAGRLGLSSRSLGVATSYDH